MTHDQHIASDPYISAWVSASAGTGKTKVLTDRVLRLLLAGAAPTRILCITYTRAAAAEMESRIGAQLAVWVTAKDDDLRRSVETLTQNPVSEKLLTTARQLFATVLDTPERIRIQTIHSFCQSILMRFPLEAEVPPNFIPIDDIASRELLEQTKESLFKRLRMPEYETVVHAIEELAAHLGESSLNKLIAEIISNRRKFAERLSLPLGRTDFNITLGLSNDATDETLVEQHLNYTSAEEISLKSACAALVQGTGKSDRETHIALSTWLGNRDDPDAYIAAFVTQQGEARKRLFTKGANQLWPQLEDVLLAEQRRVLAYSEARRSLFVSRMSSHVTTLALSMLDLYDHIKKRHGYLDYDDLIFYASRLLTQPEIAPWVLYKMDGGIDHLLVDEAQDTAPEQWRIIDVLAAEFFAGESARSIRRTLFVVGDEKQSIYSFQGAEPEAFDAMQRKLSKSAVDGGADFRRVKLDTSFRSTGPILAAVDSVFAQADARDGLIFSESNIRHEVNRKYAAGRVEIWPLEEAPDEDELSAWHIPDASSFIHRSDVRCAERIAKNVSLWLREKRQLESEARPVRPGDIMILVQRRSAFARALLRALKREYVPVAGADRLVLTEHVAVEDCLSLGHFLLLPQDDLTLAEVLRSPFINLSEEALFELAYQRGKKSLWQRLKENARYTDAYLWLSGLLAKTDYLPPYELFAYMLESGGGRKKLASRLSTEIDEPLNEFLSLALVYGQTHPPSLEGFLHWLKAGGITVKRDMEKTRDEVRILTVHGAKGLQAPIVFLPDTVRMPMHENGLLWTRGQPSIPLFSPSGMADKHYAALKDSLRSETEREYRRLLYVAMTRAEDELYICGWKGGKATSDRCWYELIKRATESWEMEDDKRVLFSTQTVAITRTAKLTSEALTETLPVWLDKPVSDEPVPARPLTPSHMRPAVDEFSPFAEEARIRGILVHRLLQHLPDVEAAERGHVMERFILRHGRDLAPAEREIIAREVTDILNHPDLAPVFGPGSVAEASIAGVAAGRSATIIAGRMDRLAVLESAVYIIDYKTGRKVPQHEAEIPDAYLRQIEAYRQLIKEIYPDKIIHCGLVWISGPKLIMLSEDRLSSMAA